MIIVKSLISKHLAHSDILKALLNRILVNFNLIIKDTALYYRHFTDITIGRQRKRYEADYKVSDNIYEVLEFLKLSCKTYDDNLDGNLIHTLDYVISSPYFSGHLFGVGGKSNYLGDLQAKYIKFVKRINEQGLRNVKYHFIGHEDVNMMMIDRFFGTDLVKNVLEFKERCFEKELPLIKLHPELVRAWLPIGSDKEFGRFMQTFMSYVEQGSIKAPGKSGEYLKDIQLSNLKTDMEAVYKSEFF